MKNEKEIRYFSMFSGVGGFELGLSRSGGNVEGHSEEENSQHSKRDKSISERQQEEDVHKKDSGISPASENSSGALFQNGQVQSNTKPSNVEEFEEDSKSGFTIRQARDGFLRERSRIRDDKESLQLREDKSNTKQFKCVGVSEIDKYASELLKQKFPTVKNWGDARTINPSELPDFDMLCGGFPCQAFSIAGKRRGFDDTRGTMFFEVARILKVKRPKLVLLENVKGLLNHEKGKTFSVIIQTLEELGYEVQWMVLNSKFFGVPQNRERVFIIGNYAGTERPEILPLRGTESEINLKYIGAIMSEQNQKWLEDGKELSRNFPQGQRVYSSEGCSSTLAGNAGGLGGKTGLYAILTPDRENKRQNGRRFKGEGEPMFTLTGQDVHGIMIKGNVNPSGRGMNGNVYSEEGIAPTIDTNKGEGKKVCQGIQIVRLTPTECERLQGFPPGWTEGFSDTQRYKMMGNAVTVNVIKAIASRLTLVEEEK